jgi:hypothetical protein
MPIDDGVFSPQYVPDPQDMPLTPESKADDAAMSVESVPEVERYGLGKPRRVVTKAIVTK